MIRDRPGRQPEGHREGRAGASPACGRRPLRWPETNVAIFALLLNLPWEFWQVAFFRGMAGAAHWPAVWLCTLAALGDAAVALVCFWLVSLMRRDRRWILRPGVREIVAFIGAGLCFTVIIEWISTRLLDRWQYAESMPTLPITGTGLLPVLQWILIPPLVVWFVRRQLT